MDLDGDDVDVLGGDWESDSVPSGSSASAAPAAAAGGGGGGGAHAAGHSNAGGSPANDDNAYELDVDVDECDEDGMPVSLESGARSDAATATAAGATNTKLKSSSSLHQLGIAMPLILNSATAPSIMKQSNVSELLRQCLAASREPISADSSTTNKDKSSEPQPHTAIHDHDDHLRSAPYHLDAGNRSSCVECLKAALIPAYSQARNLQPTQQYQLEYALKQQALTAIIQARATKRQTQHTI